MQDELIIKYIKKKKEVGMELLIDNYRGILTSVVRKHLGVFKNWICAIAKYKAIDYKRKYLAKVETLDMTDEIYYIDKDLVKQETKEEVEEILSHLNEKDRELFVKHYLEDIDLETIALKSNTKVSNLYNRLSRGRKRIRENMCK